MIFPKISDDGMVATAVPDAELLNLQPGEWVQVRPLEEISATLDEEQRHEGLYFMPEMHRFCGQSFRVFKRVKTIKLESTGEVRKLRSPAVSLEGVYCTGEYHEGCDRACLHFWREAWLKRTPPQAQDVPQERVTTSVDM